MKKYFVAGCLFMCAAVFSFAQAARNGTMYVAVKTLELKSSAGPFASTTARLEYGAEVRVTQVKGKWAEAAAAANPSLKGWAALTTLTAKRIIAGSSTTASAKEVALAGKGFNQEIENVYKSKGSLNYADVDKTEAQTVSENELRDFLTEGRLSAGDM